MCVHLVADLPCDLSTCKDNFSPAITCGRHCSVVSDNLVDLLTKKQPILCGSHPAAVLHKRAGQSVLVTRALALEAISVAAIGRSITEPSDSA